MWSLTTLRDFEKMTFEIQKRNVYTFLKIAHTWIKIN